MSDPFIGLFPFTLLVLPYLLCYLFSGVLDRTYSGWEEDFCWRFRPMSWKFFLPSKVVGSVGFVFVFYNVYLAFT